MLWRDRSQTSNQRIFVDTFQRTSLAVFWDGLSHFAWQGGQTICQSSPGRARVSPSAMLDAAKVSTTSATFGLSCSGSSASAVLQSSLASRLTALLEGRGSTLFSLTWKEQATPAGRRYCLLRASAPRTGGTGSTSVPSHWTTPTAADQHATWEQLEARKARAALNGRHIGVLLDMQAQLVACPSPTSALGEKSVRSLDGAIKEAERKGWNNDLNTAALSTQLSPWPAPTRSAGDGGRASLDPMASHRPSGAKKQFSINDAARLTGWPTPRASDENNASNSQEVIQRRIADGRATVPEMVQGMLSSWGTPTSRDWKDGDCSHLGLPVKGLVSRQVLGTTSSGSSAPTESGGRLNPDFVRWLMGYPVGWGSSAPTATRSSRRSPPRSSAPQQEQLATPSVSVFSRTGMACR